MNVIQEFKNDIHSALFFGSSGSLASRLQLLQNRIDNLESGEVADNIDPRSKANSDRV